MLTVAKIENEGEMIREQRHGRTKIKKMGLYVNTKTLIKYMLLK